MKIALVTPPRPITHSGNANTAMRWARLLRELGHRVRVQTSWDGRRADLMIALHALRSRDSIVRFASEFPDHPLVLMLTGPICTATFARAPMQSPHCRSPRGWLCCSQKA
jgi:hypothetical protein